MKSKVQSGGNRTLGNFGEELAVAYLQKQKYKIVERNYVCKCGELDIIARDGKTLVFVEVKTRKNDLYGPPQLAVTHFKQRQISRSALLYLSAKRIENASSRFDVIAIIIRGQENAEIDHIKNAFDLKY